MSFVKNIFIFPKQLLSVQNQIREQKAFVHEYLHPFLSKYHIQNDGSLTEYDFEKITNYYGIGSPVLAGEGIAHLLNVRVGKKERKTLTLMAAITGLFDDFFDRSYDSPIRIKGLMSLSNEIPPKNAHEKLFCDLVREILLISPDKKRLNEFANRVFDAQVLSLKQKELSTDWEELFNITYKKGGESLLFYRCSFATEISEQEIECLLKIGGLIQVCNDVFDINKDIKEGIRTVATETKDIKILKQKVQKLYKETFEYCKIAIPNKNMNAFLQQIKIIVSQSFVALDFYEKTQKKNGENFTPQKYPREYLICDMGKRKHLFQAGYYWIFN
tara:strand:+ start:251 stop:1240 length:990 start_codon:yes stop_codon:yes gene_type:complete